MNSCGRLEFTLEREKPNKIGELMRFGGEHREMEHSVRERPGRTSRGDGEGRMDLG